MDVLVKSRQKKWFHLVLLLVTVVLLSITVLSLAAAGPEAAPEGANETPFFSLNGTINPSASIAPTFYQSSGNRAANFSLTVSSGDAPIQLQIRNAANVVVWDHTVQVGETVWGNVTLTPGVNTFALTNPGSQAAGYNLKFFDLPATPYTWVGSAAPTGMNSQAQLIFPQSGLYTFTFGVNVDGRYEFTLDNDYIQKTVSSATQVTFYVPAGAHSLGIVQSSLGGFVNWTVGIGYAGTAVNSLPYSKSSAQINEEWLPIFLAAPAQVNMVVAATGDPGDTLYVEVNENTHSAAANQTVQTGETTWLTFDLPAGQSLIHLTASGGLVSYNLTVDALPTAAYTWSGQANASGANSKARLQFPTAGLYTFDFSVNGRYQFLLEVDGASYIQKTVESGSDDVVYYVPAGSHMLTLAQDTALGADWDVGISLLSAGTNSLPYTKTGGHIGGVGNDFSQEWLPLALDATAVVNLSVDLTGSAADDLVLEVYQTGSSTPDFVSAAVMGNEKAWFTFDLAAGANRLRLRAIGNSGPLAYDLDVKAVPSAAAAGWSGFSLASGTNSVIMVNFPTTGLYHFSLGASIGFANLVLDDAMTAPRAPQASSDVSYDVEVTAGLHEVYVLQDPAYAATDWSAAIHAAAAGDTFFVFDGTLAPGESVAPEYTVPSGTLDFNFALAVTGADVDLAITDGSSGIVWDDSALDGETVWGTGTLTGKNIIHLTNNGAASATISLVFYHLPTAAYTWDGLAAPTGAESHIRLIFPQDGLYTFAAGVVNGRYQFLLTLDGDDHIQKTAESNTSVTYFVPAGLHDLTLWQDSTVGADWDLSVSAVGAAANSLPYEKTGGDLGGAANDFTEEWLPIHLGQAAAVNMSVSVDGAAADSLLVEVQDGSGAVLDSLELFGLETAWSTLDLTADARIRLTAVGNTAPVAYEIALTAVPEPDTDWAGISAGNGAASHVRIHFPTAGLYTFDLGQSAGRYQLLVNDEFIQKTVEGDTAVTYFVPAGTHDIVIDQDSALGATWDVALTGPTAAADTLPYQKMGGELGGLGNDFSEEWLPIHTGTQGLVNLALTITGAAADAVRLEVWDAVTTTMTLPAVYGTETVWSAFTLPADARLRLVTDAANGAAISYDLEISDVPQPAYAWSGVSLEDGLNANILVDLDLSGTYQLAVVLDEGFTNFAIDAYPPARIASGSSYTLTFSRPAGLYSFTSIQSAGYPVTSWAASLSLLSAEAPEVLAISPDWGTVGTDTAVTIDGSNFMAGIAVELVNGGVTYDLTDVLVVSATQLLANVPDVAQEGTYDLRVTNPDDQTAVLPGAFTVFGAVPVVDSITPDAVKANIPTAVTISGSSFLNGATVSLVSGFDEYVLSNVVVVSMGEITAVVPAGIPVGSYDVVVTNPDDQSGQLTAGLDVVPHLLFLPVAVK